MIPVVRRSLSWSFPVALIGCLAFVSACGDDDPDAGIPDTGGAGDSGITPDGGTADSGPTETLYDRLGGNTGIGTAITGFIGRVVADPKINGYFLNSSVNGTRLATCLTKQLGSLTGGPQTYPANGAGPDSDGCRSMTDAHGGLGISQADFTDLAGHLLAELEARGVSAADRATITNALGTLVGDIVEDATSNATIYQRAGRKPAVTVVIDDFLGRVLGDPKINGYFLNNTLVAARLRTCLVRQVCGLTGGPCKYGEEVETEIDRDADGTVEAAEVCQGMMAVHTGLGISTNDYNDLRDHLVAALTAAGVVGADVTTVTEVLNGAGLRSQVITDVNNNLTIYQRVGRKPAAQSVITGFLGRVLADVSINGYFLNDTLNANRLSGCLVRQVCGLIGGPCRYGLEVETVFDKDADGTIETNEVCQGMMAVHAGLGISQRDFDDLAGHLVAELTAASVPLADINTITGVLSQQAFVDTIVEDANNNLTIYQRASRKDGVVIVIDDFLGRVTANNAINGYFLNSSVSVPRLRTCLIRQVCGLLGGPCRYGQEVETEIDRDADGTVEAAEKCANMMDIHMGLGISQNDFNDLASDLTAALTAANVSAPDIATITSALTQPGLVSQIVEDTTNNATVYQRVGRKPAIRTVTLDFTSRVSANVQVNGFFLNMTVNRLNNRFNPCIIRQVCSIDGPCKYGEEVEMGILSQGGVCRTMAATHLNMMDDVASPITIADFNAIVNELVAAMTAANVTPADRTAVVNALAPLCTEIVPGGTGC